MRHHWYHGFVRHKFPDTPYTFAKGLVAKLNNVEPPIEPYESYFGVMVSETEADIINKQFVDRAEGGGTGSLWGRLGKCYELIYWASGGLYWGNELKEQREKGSFNGPQEFTVNIWKEIDQYTFESVFDLTFQGVKWIDVAHAGSDGASDCWGTALFTYEKKLKNVSYQPMKCDIPTSIKYPSLYLGELMIEHAKTI